MDNPIANMYGPHFLVFYAVVIAATLLAVRLWVRLQDPTTGGLTLRVATEPVPYEIAYLRGGENRLTEAVIVNLCERGYLNNIVGMVIEQAADHPDPRHLSTIEKEVFDFFEEDRERDDVAKLLSVDSSEYEERLQDEQLLAPPELRATADSAAKFAAFVIIGLGLYKLVIALSSGRSNVLFLIVLGVIGIVALFKIHQPRITARGRALLKELEQTYLDSKEVYSEAEPTLPLLVGVFGVAALAGSPVEDYQSFFKSKSSGWFGGGGWGGCGGGCGGGGCGGGGCGGGCGGCGG